MTSIRERAGLDVSALILALVPRLTEHADALTGLPGQVLTGLLAFGAAGFLHEAFDALSSVAKRRTTNV